MEFRTLKPDEIEVRIGQVSAKGVTLLLYKNARVDMQLLDEVVGPQSWQREHYECKGNLFCRVGIRYDFCNEWIWKSDCGSESNVEKEKGEASDSFKRACVNWGIGRELYTSPKVFVSNEEAGVKDGKCYTRFVVTEIGYDENRCINKLSIGKLKFNGDLDCVVWTTGNTKADADLFKIPTMAKAKEPPKTKEAPKPFKTYMCEECGTPISENVAKYSNDIFNKALCMKCQGKVTK